MSIYRRLLIWSAVAFALIVVSITHAAPIRFSDTAYTSNSTRHGFRLVSENTVTNDGGQYASLVYACMDYRENLYLIVPDDLNPSAFSDFEFKFDDEEPIGLNEGFLDVSADGKAYSISYNAPTFAANEPVRSIYRGMKLADELLLRASREGDRDSIALFFDLEGTAEAMRNANDAGGCDMTHIRK